MRHVLFVPAAIALVSISSCSLKRDDPLSLAEMRIVDLTHNFDADTVYWPTDKRGFQLEQLAAGHTEAGLENLTNLDALPTTGFTVIALPMKIAGGSGGPVRVIAMLDLRTEVAASQYD